MQELKPSYNRTYALFNLYSRLSVEMLARGAFEAAAITSM